jgi:hypothetical protein
MKLEAHEKASSLAPRDQMEIYKASTQEQKVYDIN